MRFIPQKMPVRYKNMIVSQHVILILFWTVLTALFIVALVWFVVERNYVNSGHNYLNQNVNDILTAINNGNLSKTEIQDKYHQLALIKYPLIDFSLMSFGILNVNNSATISDWAAAWTQRQSNMNMAYSYIFITSLIAAIAWVFYFVVIIRLACRNHFEKKYGLSNKYPNNYAIFTLKMYLDFISNLAIVFSFFNFLSTIIALVYGVFLVLVSYIIWYGFKKHTEILTPHAWWKAKNFSFFAVVVIVQNLIILLKSIFLKDFNVDLDLVIQLVFPIGTITVIISVFIKNMVTSKVTGVNTAIKGIDAKIGSFRIFYYTQREKSLEDYTFVSQLPVLIKKPLAANKIDVVEGYRLMNVMDETITFLEKHLKKDNERKYMLYHLYNNVVCEEELNEIVNNVKILEQCGKDASVLDKIKKVY